MPESAQLVTLDQNKLDRYWELLRNNTSTFVDGMVSRDQFDRIMMRDSIIYEIPGCLIFMEHIIPHCRAEVHLAIWDKKISDKTDQLKDLLMWVFMVFDLHRIETFVPEDYRTMRRFVEKKMGFTFEGTLRSRAIRRGRPIDMKAYAILRDEVL